MSFLNRTEHVVIVGGGYAGLPCAAKLGALRKGSSRYRVTLISKDPRQELTCELYRSLRFGESALFAYPDLLRSLDVIFEESSLQEIDPHKKILRLRSRSRSEISYDHLILATGRKAYIPGIEGLNKLMSEKDATEQKVFLFKSQAQVQALRLALRKIRWDDESPKARDQFVVIMGAGSTGLEVAGELAAMRGRHPQARIVILDERSDLAKDFSPIARKILKKQLSKLQIETVLGSPAQRLTDKEIFLKNGQVIPWDLLILCSGASLPQKILEPFEDQLDSHWGLKVDGHFRVSGFSGLYALGDIARVPYPHEGLQNLKFVPHRAQFAIQQGFFLAESLHEYFHKGAFPKTVFEPHDLGYLIALGPESGVGRLGPEVIGKFQKLLSPFVYGARVNDLKRAAHYKYLAQLKTLKLRAQVPSPILPFLTRP